VTVIRQGALLGIACALLAACSDPTTPPDSPTGFGVTAGDGQVVVSYTQDPNLTYWIFLAQASSITRQNYDLYPGARIVTPAVSPQVVGFLTNGIQYSFLMNATSGGPSGPSTSSLSATPRAAGNSYLAAAPNNTASNNGIAFGILPAPSEPVFVMVGQGGAVYTSTVNPGGSVLDVNGNQPWTTENSNVSSNLNAVAYNPTLARFVAVGDAGTIIWSTNGQSWSTAANPATSANLYGVTSYGQAFVAVGQDGTVVTSADGSNWVLRQGNTSADLLGVNYVAGFLCAVGRSGTLMYSADSQNWAEVPVPTTSDLHAFIYGRPNNAAGAAFYIFGAGGTIMVASSPLSNWTLETQPASANNLYAAAIGSRIVAVGANGSIIYSDDGFNWQLANNPNTTDLFSVVYAIGIYTAVGADGESETSF
jgi:photosystem II stability/assembly factor-like uncharacterized protein